MAAHFSGAASSQTDSAADKGLRYESVALFFLFFSPVALRTPFFARAVRLYFL